MAWVSDNRLEITNIHVRVKLQHILEAGDNPHSLRRLSERGKYKIHNFQFSPLAGCILFVLLGGDT